MTKIKLPKGILKDIIIVVIGVLIIWMGLRVVFGTENPFYVVSSGSMVPELQIFDVLVVQGNDPFESVKIGDIIVFNRPSGQDRVIVHRVTSITNEDPFTIRTKGDANPTSIPGTDFPVTEEEYIGKVAYVIPQVGYVTRILTPPINYIIIAIIISVMIGKQLLKNKKDSSALGIGTTSRGSILLISGYLLPVIATLFAILLPFLLNEAINFIKSTTNVDLLSSFTEIANASM
ncbi:MAG: signal peptidase I, partial [Thaumarchaeota archaeon]|nr:signal peptidase I [Nitrososphaerota archaeon]